MSKTIERIDLMGVSPGTARHVSVHRYGRKGARPKAYLQASLHADETPGMLVQHHLMKMLDEADRAGAIRGEIIVVPVANPIGLGQWLNHHMAGRYELGGGGNFNRGWPDLHAGLAQRVAGKLGPDPATNVATARAAMAAGIDEFRATTEMTGLRLAVCRLAHDADFVFDLHCDDDSLMHLFLVPAHWPDAADLAADIGTRAILLAEDSGGRSFDETFSTPWTRLAATLDEQTPLPAACMAATIEYRGQADANDELAAADAAGLFRFFQRRGLVGGDAGPLPTALCEATMLDACDVVRSPVAGIATYRRPLGAWIEKGETIAEIVDPLADDPRQARTPVQAQTEGMLLSRRSHKMVRPGDSLAKVVGREPLAYRQGMLLED
ncbi:MAG: succinylglutamate desuccinylase/aspartoacylase family protein [Dongiaceae bacterium]